MGLVLPPGVILSPNERGATMHSPRQQRKMHVPWLDGPALWLSLPPAPSCHRPSSLVTGRRLPSLGQMGTLLRVFLLKVHTQSAVGTEDFVVPPGLHRSAGSTPDVKAALPSRNRLHCSLSPGNLYSSFQSEKRPPLLRTPQSAMWWLRCGQCGAGGRRDTPPLDAVPQQNVFPDDSGGV